MSKERVNKMCPVAKSVSLGDKVDGLITAVNEVKTSISSIVALVNDLKAKYNAAVTLINELKADHNNHCANTAVHYDAVSAAATSDTTNTTSAADSEATSQSDASGVTYSDIDSL